MDIQLYRTACKELREKFGEKAYPSPALNDAWVYWKDKPDAAFLDLKNQIMSLGTALRLFPISDSPLKPSEAVTDSTGTTSHGPASGFASEDPPEREDPHEAIGLRILPPPPRADHPVQMNPDFLDKLKQKHGVRTVAELVQRGLWKDEQETPPERPTGG